MSKKINNYYSVGCLMRYFTKVLLLAMGLNLAGGLSVLSAAAATPPAKAFGELPLAYDADLSPDGKHLAIIVNSNGQYYIATRDTSSGTTALKGTGLGKNIRPQYVKWVNNDRYFVSFIKSEELDGVPYSVGYIYTRDVNEKEGRILLKPNFFRQWNNTIVNWLDDDPDHVLMSYITIDRTVPGVGIKKASSAEWPAVYKVDVAKGKDKLVERSQEFITNWLTDPSGNPIIGIGRNDGAAKMIVKDVKSDKWASHSNYPGLDADTPIFSILKGGTRAVIGDYNGRDTLGLYIYDLEQKRRIKSLFHNDVYDVSGVVLSTDGETIIGAQYIAEQQETELLGKHATLLDKMRTKYPGFSVDYVDQTDDGNSILFMLSAPYEPGGLFLYTAGGGEPTMIERRYSNITSPDMGNVVSVKYTARDGQKIPAFVTLPPSVTSQAGLKNLPFIVLPHGGPYGRDEKRFDYFAQFFATRGYGVLQMNFRGSEGFGKSFEQAGRNNWVLMQEDVEDGTKYLFNKGYADPNRTCIAGWSYGGYAALMGAAKDTEGLYDCVISMAGLTDIDSAKKDLKDYVGGRAAARTFFGTGFDSSAVRKANSPVDVADQIKVPVFLAHGDLDENVRFTQFTKMKKALEKAGADGTYMSFKNEDHFLSKQSNREAFFEGVDKFLTKVNGPSEHIKK